MRLFTFACLLAAIAVLPGCAHREPRTVIQEVRVPIPVSCVTGDYPAKPYAADQVSLTGDIFELVRALLVDREQRKITEAELRAEREACR